MATCACWRYLARNCDHELITISRQASQPVRSNFLSIQTQMTPKMRTVLVDWLINVHYQFKLLPETLYMGIGIMDRFFQVAYEPRVAGA